MFRAFSQVRANMGEAAKCYLDIHMKQIYSHHLILSLTAVLVLICVQTVLGFTCNLTTNLFFLVSSSKSTKSTLVTDLTFDTTFQRIANASSGVSGLNGMLALVYSQNLLLNNVVL
jgi:hypothetical protein